MQDRIADGNHKRPAALRVTNSDWLNKLGHAKNI